MANPAKMVSTGVLLAAHAFAQQPADPAAEFFEAHIRPVFANNCLACHGDAETGGLRLDSRENMLKGGKSGPAIVPGQPDSSLLIQAVQHTQERLKMPPGKKLTDTEIRDLRAWVTGRSAVAGGKAASFPRTESSLPSSARSGRFNRFTRPLRRTCKTRHGFNLRSIALFWRSSNRRGSALLAAADKRTLIRRATFDLIGLPATLKK